MRPVIVLILCCLAVGAQASDSYLVTATPAGDQVVLQVGPLPMSLTLAHIEVPAAQQEAAREALRTMIGGKRVELVYLADFGVDARGAARVQVVSGRTNVNEELVARGLARYQPAKEGSAAEGPLKRAQDKAQKSGVGLWREAVAVPAVAAPAAAGLVAKSVAKPAAAVVAKGPFCSELDNTFYYATGSREVANVSPQRLIFYADEATAQKAGKRKQAKVETAKRGTTEADADAAFELGRKIAGDAVDAGNTSNRDELYEKAYVNLTQAMQIYSDLVDKKPDDEALATKLQQCMQIRYGTVKMRRFAH